VPRLSAGILLYRTGGPKGPEVLIVHPGGPVWRKKRGKGTWTIPKGELDPDDAGDPLTAAEREFAEEVGAPAPSGARIPLGEIVQAGGKHVLAWAAEGDLETTDLTSNQFEMEWPPHSGSLQSFPEVDEARWCTIPEAARLLKATQAELLDRLVALVGDVGHRGTSQRHD
jgi:predicted NUDIX family NTP pyrophosphohydrolase